MSKNNFCKIFRVKPILSLIFFIYAGSKKAKYVSWKSNRHYYSTTLDRLRPSDILCCTEVATKTTAILDVYKFFALYLIEIWMEQIVIFSVWHEIFQPIVCNCNCIVSFVVITRLYMYIDFSCENISTMHSLFFGWITEKVSLYGFEQFQRSTAVTVHS
jgi:hypothetical protein